MGHPAGRASPLVTLNTVRSNTRVLIACLFGGPVVPLVRICSATPGSASACATGVVATLQSGDRCDRGSDNEIATPALPARLAAATTSSVQSCDVGDDRRQVQRLDVAADRLRRLERVDHRDRATGGEEPDDRGGVRQPVADHQPDRCVVGDACIAQHRGDGVGVCRDVGAGVPAALELDARPFAVARQPCRELFGKAFGHDRR